ncbi:Poly [ADP-ribose] polymerase 1-like protein [Leptotrombidium deliense]|uniref:Poly [ADP-ribose] polymerase n=1 Tax=Leptotrombidium deliense TaxID=299467 RepID=A0A443SN69_9ACAR|nr:Poly [ADP-ribose] polymerase 1-like protein [Leptotrombidium deliense]
MEESTLRLEQKFRAEYAKSGRAACKSCGSNIGNGDLRMAVMVQNRFADGKVPMWHHFKCFFAKYNPASTGDIGHFNNLKYEDQKRIEEQLKTAKDNPKDYSVEYAKGGGAMCKLCESKIPKNEIRISKLDYENETSWGPPKRWFHFECFVSARQELGFLLAGEKIPGYSMLEGEDQKKIRDKLKPVAKKRKGEEANGVAAKKGKEDDKLKKQSDLLYGYIEKLQSMKRQDIVDLLEYNHQDVPSQNSSKCERLADCMAFGALKKCPECKNGQLTFRIAGYICCGYLTEFSKCLYETQTPARNPFKIPTEMRDEYDFLKEYKYKERTRIYNEVQASTSGINHIAKALEAGTVATEVKEEKIESKLPLSGHKFAVVGKIAKSNKSTVKKHIEKLGGKIVNEVDRTVLFVLSNADELEKESQLILDAKKCDIPVVSAGFLDDLKHKSAEDLMSSICDIIKSNTISSWGNDVDKKYQKLSEKSKLKSFKSAFGKSGSGLGSGKSAPKIQTLKMKGGLVVDPDSELDHCSHVYKSKNDVYSAVLNKVDIASNKNSYYKIQLLESDETTSSDKHKYWVFRSWGRIGTDIGGNKVEKFKNKDDAIENFESVYLDQTGNEWTERKGAKKVPGKYYPIEISYKDEKQVETKLEVGKSCLPLPVQELISLIFDVQKMREQMVEFNLDLNKMPLGKISKKQILEAYSILNEVSTFIDSKKQKLQLVLDASNRFYSLIPHDFGTDNVPVINNHELLKEKLDMLDSLLEMELAYELVADIKQEDDDVLKKHYDKLNAEIDVLGTDCEEYSIIEKYVKNTHGKTHSSYSLKILDIFKVSRQEEVEKFKKDLHNRMLLWHGSRITNFAGILSQGLRIAPPEAPVTGYMFGKGIYFADMVSKSANYCCTTPTNNVGLLLLCDVALGDMHELEHADFVTKLPEDKHSVKGIGQAYPNSSEFHELPSGTVVPCGKQCTKKSKKTSLLYNEYIVYNVNQVNINFLRVEQKFRAEYASSGNSRCRLRVCRSRIQNEELRMAVMMQDKCKDGKIPHWHHFECFFKKYNPASTGDIAHFSQLQYEDQKRIEEKLNAAKSNPNNFAVEYAKNSSMTCKMCEKEILENELIFSKLFYENGTYSDFTKNWFHFECFVLAREELLFLRAGEEIPGYSSIKESDQQKIRDELKPIAIKRKAEETNGGLAKKIKEDELKEQSDLLYKYIKQIKSMIHDDIVNLLKFNDQEVPRKNSSKYERLADCMAFGALNKCQLICLLIAGYICSGYFTEFSPCLYSTFTPARTAFKIPQKMLDDYDFLKEYSYEERIRIYNELQPSTAATDHIEKAFEARNMIIEVEEEEEDELPLNGMKSGLVVDANSKLDHCSHVYKSEDDVYSAVLNKVVIASNLNSYYKIQLLESDEAKISGERHYWVFRSWGRIGTDIGKTITKMFENKDPAIQKFEELYFEKTGNKWTERKYAKKVPGKYFPIETKCMENGKINSKLEVENSCLPVALQELITLIFDVQKMRDQMVDFKLDLEKIPLGQISNDQILNAYSVLDKLSLLLNSNEQNIQLVMDASNKFYSLIPHDFGTDNVPAINDLESVNEKYEMLDSLFKMNSAYQIVTEIIKEKNDLLKQYYDKLNADIAVLNVDCEEYSIIEKYVMNTHGGTHSKYSLKILDIFKVNKQDEIEKFKKDMHNRMLLWHGSRITNFAGILSQGLRIAPPEAPVTGYMFGKGIYFADMVSKSANYCHTSPTNNVGLLLLCDVALGNMYELQRSMQAMSITQLPENIHSVKGVGQTYPNRNEFLELASGTVVPCGKPCTEELKETSLHYNEYIVYDVNQVNIKYLLKVEFIYNN